jgi:hypothetical protein
MSALARQLQSRNMMSLCRLGGNVARLFSFGATVAVAFDDDRLSVMQKTIQQSGGHGGVTGKDPWPVFEGNVGGTDDRAALVAFGVERRLRRMAAPLRRYRRSGTPA